MIARLDALQQANMELAATTERLRLAVEATKLAVWDWNIASGDLEFLPNISDMLGYPRIHGTPTHSQGRSLTHPDDIPTFDAAFKAHARGETARLDVQVRVKHHDGDWRWFHCRGEIFARAEDGAPLRAVGTFEDITAKREEAADRQFLSDLTSSLIQTNHQQSIVNMAMQKLALYLKAERVGISELTKDRKGFLTRAVWSHSSLPIPPREHRTAYSAALIEEVCTKGTLVIEDVQTDPRSKGSPTAKLYAKMDIHGLLNVPMQAEGRSPVFLYVHSCAPRKWQPREISLCEQVAELMWNSINRARAEVVKESSEELLTMALQVARLGAFERDLKSGAVRISEGFFDLIGHPEIESGTLVEYLSIIHPEDREAFAAKIADARALGENYELDDEHRIITASGDVRIVAYKSRTRFEADEEGVQRLVRAAAVIQDVTEQRRQIEIATVAQERLYKMSRLTAMGTMASTLAHELNQPLTAAANYLNVLRTLEISSWTKDGINRPEVLALAAKSVLDAGKIIKKIRDFTSGSGLQRLTVSLLGVADNARQHTLEQLGPRAPEVTVDVPETLMVTVDELQIEQVLSNLIRNAAEAMTRQKGGKIILMAREHAAFVDFHVTDNGPGIPDDFAAGLFNPFQSSKSEGMGLGLSLCRTMVEAHGGHLTLEKHDSTGCDFLIRLPKAERRKMRA